MNVRSGTGTAGSAARGRPAVGQKDQRILDAALRLFAQRGFHGTAVPLVAQEAGVATGTIYHYFASKELLVNAVFRDAKSRLRDALLENLDLTVAPRQLFRDIWARLVGFAHREPVAFQFLEMQDHAPYLDDESRALEVQVLLPLLNAGEALAASGGARKMPVEVLMALVWGALVGLVKAERLGYITVSEQDYTQAGEACWDAISKAHTKR